jgi:two-component system response regulator
MKCMTRNLLLVEDNGSDEKLTLRALRQCGVAHGVDVVRDGVEALDYVFATGAHAHRAGAPLPNLILLDLNLPRLDGIEVLRRIRADDRTRFLPVVILTSSKEREDVLRSYANGANGYVHKPVDFEKFTDGMKALGTFWLVVNEPAPEEN